MTWRSKVLYIRTLWMLLISITFQSLLKCFWDDESSFIRTLNQHISVYLANVNDQSIPPYCKHRCKHMCHCIFTIILLLSYVCFNVSTFNDFLLVLGCHSPHFLPMLLSLCWKWKRRVFGGDRLWISFSLNTFIIQVQI